MAKKTEPEQKDKLDRLIKGKKGDPETEKYKKKLTAAGIKEPALSQNVKDILKQPKGSKRDAKADEIIKDHKKKGKPESVAEDPKMADYKKRLEAAGYSGKDLEDRLKSIQKKPDEAAKEAEVQRLVDKKKAGGQTPSAGGSGAKKPYTEAELDKILKELGYTDDVDRKKRVDSLAKKPRDKQDEDIKAMKQRKLDAAKKADLNKKLEDAGMKSATERKKKVDEIFPKSEAEQAAAIKAVKDAKAASGPPADNGKNGGGDPEKNGSEPKKNRKTPEQAAASTAEQEKTKAELDKALKDAGYADDKDRGTKVDSLLRIPAGPEREKKLKEYVDRKKGSKGGPTADPANGKAPPAGKTPPTGTAPPAGTTPPNGKDDGKTPPKPGKLISLLGR
jgi:hypothetical protein